jgi:hypothetical protein
MANETQQKIRKPNKTDNNKQMMLEKLEFHLGIVSRACKDANINRSTHYDWMENDPEYSKAVNEISEIAIDAVESELFKQIKEGNVTAIIFYLKTKGKKRGYIERTEIDYNKHSPDLSGITTDEIYTLLNESNINQ